MTTQNQNADGTEERYVTKNGAVIDPKRFITADRFYFAPLDVESTVALERLLARKELAGEDLIITAEVNGGRHIGFPTEQLAYHHVAQGSINGEPWMVSF